MNTHHTTKCGSIEANWSTRDQQLKVHIPRDTVNISLHIDTMEARHSIKMDPWESHSQYRAWGPGNKPGPSVRNLMRHFETWTMERARQLRANRMSPAQLFRFEKMPFGLRPGALNRFHHHTARPRPMSRAQPRRPIPSRPCPRPAMRNQMTQPAPAASAAGATSPAHSITCEDVFPSHTYRIAAEQASKEKEKKEKVEALLAILQSMEKEENPTAVGASATSSNSTEEEIIVQAMCSVLQSKMPNTEATEAVQTFLHAMRKLRIAKERMTSPQPQFHSAPTSPTRSDAAPEGPRIPGSPRSNSIPPRSPSRRSTPRTPGYAPSSPEYSPYCPQEGPVSPQRMNARASAWKN